MYDVIDVEATTDTPRVKLDKKTAVFEIEGTSFPEDVRVFYGPILFYLNDYVESPLPKTEFHFRLSYFNTASSKIFLDVMLYLEKVHRQEGCEVEIVWHYEEGDEDMEESGYDYSEIIKTPFRFESHAPEHQDEDF